jgi:hypothetical protein
MTTWTNTAKNFVSWIWNGLVSAYNLDGNSTDSAGSNNGTDTGIQYVAGKIGQAAQFSGISTSGLVSYYKLDANSNDSVGSNNGTDTAISYASAGIIGNCATFNGSSSQIDLGTSASLNFTTSDFAFSFWIRRTTSITYSGLSFTGAGIQLDIQTNRVRLLTFQSGAGQVVASANVLPLNTLTHVVVTRSGSVGKIYYNSVEQTYSQQDSLINPLTTAAHALWGTDTTNFFTGSLDEIAIFSRAPAAYEISSLYNSGAARALQYFGSKVVVADNSSLKPTGNFSVSFKLQTSNVIAPTADMDVIFQSYSQNGTVSGFEIMQNNTTPQKLRFVSGKNTGVTQGTDWQECLSSSTINDGIAHSWVCSYDGVKMYIYKDGVLDNSVAWTVNSVYASPNYIRMGCANQTGTDLDFWNGTLSNLYIYNRALTAGEAAGLNNGGNGIQYPNIPSIWTNETY